MAKRHEVTTVNTFETWKENLESQVELWRENFEDGEDVYFLVGEWHKDKFPTYSTKTPKEGAGSIAKAGYAPDVFQEDKVMNAFKESDKTLFGTLTLLSTHIADPEHPQVYTMEEYIDMAEELFKEYREDSEEYALVGGVAYNGIDFSAANSNDYKRVNKQKFDPSIFKSSKDAIGKLNTVGMGWYGTIIVNQKYLSEEWSENLEEQKEEE